MQCLLAVAAVVGSVLSVGAQGPWGFGNLDASLPEQKVYIDEWLNPAALVPGGREYVVALYFAPLSVGEAFLTQVGGTGGFLGHPHQRYGLFSGGSRTVATDNWGGPGLFQVKGWESAYGSTYEEAAANPAARRGESPIFIADTANPKLPEPVSGLIINSSDQQPFCGFVIAVPEPPTSVLFFGGLVAAVVGICRKGKRRFPQ